MWSKENVLKPSLKLVCTFINQSKLSFSMNSVRINIKVKKFGLFYKTKSLIISFKRRPVRQSSFTLVEKAK